MTTETNILDEDFDCTEMHPMDIQELIESLEGKYSEVSKHDRRKFRENYNKLVDTLTEKRGYVQYKTLK